jgi:hypothetical protein
MPSRVADLTALRALAATVGAFHVTDRGLIAAQQEFTRRLAEGEPDAAATRAYLAAVRRYFRPYEREAVGQLAYVDRELERLYQLQYNLVAERGVVAKRVEAVRGVLATLAELAPE